MQLTAMEEKPKKDILEKAIDLIFSLNKNKVYLISILLLGFILRLIAAINLSVSADDMHHVTHAINFYSAERLITYDQSSGLWHAFTSIMYNTLGTTQLASRIAALIFGSLSILLIYLLTKEFFNEKTAIFASFLLAIAPFHIQNTMAEMDVMTIFFVLLAMLFFIKALKNNKTYFYLVSGISLGLAIYTKVYPLLFIPSLLLFFIYWNKKEKKEILTKSNLKFILVFLIAIFIFTLPALTHNYLLFKNKGFMDLQFTRTFGLGKDISAQYYSWDHQFSAKNDWLGLIFGESTNSANKMPTLISAIDFIRITDPINFYLGFIGLLIVFLYKRDNRDYVIFFLLSILFVLPFLASIILLPKHYIFFEVLFIPLGALTLRELNSKLSKFSRKSAALITTIILIIALIILGLPAINHLYGPNMYSFYGKSYMAQIIEFKEKNVPQNSLIIADSRMYRGNLNWAFQGRPYLEGIDFINLLNKKDELPGKEILIDTFLFECIKDDCGWGTIKDQPDLNNTMESLIDLFKTNGKLVKTISMPVEGKTYYPIIGGEREDLINIYQSKVTIKDSIIPLASQPKEWFLYTISYQPIEKQFDYYETNNIIDKSLDKLAHLVVTIALILSFFSIFFAFYLSFKNENINNNPSL